MKKQEQPYQRFHTRDGSARIRRRSPSLSRHREMTRSAQSTTKSNLPVSRLALYADEYLSDCATAHSLRTVEKRRMNIERLLRYLREHDHTECSITELRAFFSSLRNLHTGEPLRTITVDTIRRDLGALWRWMIDNRYVHESPVENIRKPKVKTDQTPPLTEEQIRAVVEAARQSFFAPRETAIVLFLLDTGVRASELCGLQIRDLDLQHGTARIRGKGDKKRGVYFSKRTTRALYQYLEGRLEPGGDDEQQAVFVAETGHSTGEPLTRSGVYQIVQRLILKAGIKGTKKGAHLLRHTFTYHFFKRGGQQQTAMMLLGHDDPKMTHHYCKLAEADCKDSHTKYSPVDGMKL
jgi:integrase/recombinase XerD